MNITVLAVGKLKEKYWQDAIREYSKRLGKYCRFQIVEVKESLLRARERLVFDEFFLFLKKSDCTLEV